MHPAGRSYKNIKQCYCCHRKIRDCNANLCGQRKYMMLFSSHPYQGINQKLPAFAHPPQPVSQPIPFLLDNIRMSNQVNPPHPNTIQQLHRYDPLQEQKVSSLIYLHQKGGLEGRVHTARMKYCSVHGMVVDLIISGSDMIKECSHSYRYSDDIPSSNLDLTNGNHIIEDVVLPWSIFPNSISSLPVNIQIQSTSQYIPPGSTFKVYCETFDIKTKKPYFQMANRSTPKFKLPSYIQTKITYSSNEPKQSNIKNTRPRFLIILDFEATCDFGPNPVITPETSEIIEFPWVVLDTLTLNIVYKKQIYVKPSKIEGITNYCSQLTGITKEHCETGLSLNEAIDEFNLFLKEKILPFGKNNYRILTDGVWDLEFQLPYECKRKNIPLESWFKNYFDIRQEFRKFYSWFSFSEHAPNLRTMLDAYSLGYIGRQHSGLDDCLTISQIVKILLQLHPNTFTRPKLIPDEQDPFKQLAPQFARTCFCPPGAWKCENKNCNVWNHPFITQCKFCNQRKS